MRTKRLHSYLTQTKMLWLIDGSHTNLSIPLNNGSIAFLQSSPVTVAIFQRTRGLGA